MLKLTFTCKLLYFRTHPFEEMRFSSAAQHLAEDSCGGGIQTPPPRAFSLQKNQSGHNSPTYASTIGQVGEGFGLRV